MKVYVCIINSEYYDDKLSHIDRIYENRDQAEAFKTNYEQEMRDNSKKKVVPVLSGDDEDLDRYNVEKAEVDKARKFISVEIQPFVVL